MKKRLNRFFGQATVEMALLLPIAAFLLYWTVTAFRTNQTGSEKSIQRHTEALAKFQHGNGTMEIDGVDVPPPAILVLLPPRPGSGGPSLGEIVAQQAVGALARLGLDSLLNAVPFLNDSTYVSAGSRGFLTGAGNSFINSGFKKVDWEQALRTGVASAIRSDQGSEDFQGDDFAAGGARELFGSGVQEALANYAQTGDTFALASGALGGLTNSDSAKAWLNGGDELIKAAALGAIEGTVAGLKDGKLQLKEVALAAGTRSFNTKTVAGLIPGTSWNGDPRRSATFGAVNAALSTFVSGGNLGQAVYAASAGALFSGQGMKAIAGDSTWAAAGVGLGYSAGVGLIKGQNIGEIGKGALNSMTQSITSIAINKFEEEIQNRGDYKHLEASAAETVKTLTDNLENSIKPEPLAETATTTEDTSSNQSNAPGGNSNTKNGEPKEEEKPKKEGEG